MNTPSIGDACSGLAGLIESRNRTELECRKYLSFVSHLLVDGVSSDRSYDIAEEYRCHTGSVDYVIATSVWCGSAVPVVKAFLWELKAPQCYVFEHDDNSQRLRPTMDLVKAENQLFTYCDEARECSGFLRRFKVSHRDNVMPGGIIIGSPSTLVKKPQHKDVSRMFNDAYGIREKYIYNSSRIRLYTWDYILKTIQDLGKSEIKMDAHGTSL